MLDVLYRATKYMNVKDALLAQEEKPKKRERQDNTQQEDRHSKPPVGRFVNFTSLTALIDQVLMQIKDDAALTWPNKLKGDPSKRYCHFH